MVCDVKFQHYSQDCRNLTFYWPELSSIPTLFLDQSKNSQWPMPKACLNAGPDNTKTSIQYIWLQWYLSLDLNQHRACWKKGLFQMKDENYLNRSLYCVNIVYCCCIHLIFSLQPQSSKSSLSLYLQYSNADITMVKFRCIIVHAISSFLLCGEPNFTQSSTCGFTG